MPTFLVTTETPLQRKTLKAICKALEIPCKLQKEAQPYDPEFVAKIEQGERDITAGKGIIMTLEEIEALCG